MSISDKRATRSAPPATARGHKAIERSLRDTVRRGRLQMAAAGRIGRQEELQTGDVEGLARKITEIAARVVGCQRANIWLFDDSETSLRCIDLFDSASGLHSEGMVLEERQYASEFQALKRARYVNADDARTDPRTVGYLEAYLEPLHITSMLDTVIEVSGRHLGLLCLEHVDRPHHWTPDELAFAGQLADKFALALVSHRRGQAEQELRASERRFRTIYDSVADSLFVHDVGTGAFVDANRRASELFGYSREEILAGDVGMLSSGIPPYTQADALARVLATDPGDGHPFEWHFRRKDGSLFWGEVCLRRCDFGDREIVLAEVRDITERQRTETERRESRQLLANIINAVPVRIFWKDVDLNYLGCNAIFARDAGLADPAEIVGRNDHELAWRKQADRYRADDRAVIDGGQSRLLFEEPQTTPTGESIVLLTSKVPLRRPDGEISGVVGTYMDITDRKRTEDALRASEARFRAVSETALDAIVIVSGAGEILYWNRAAARILGYGRQEALGMTVDRFLMPPRNSRDAIAASPGLAPDAAGEAQGGSLELTARRKDGTEIPVELSLSVMNLGAQWNVVAILRDITERRQAEQRIHRMAHRDFLTDLANRADFVDTLDGEIARARRTGSRFAVLYLDLDHFKDVNDTLGHPIGDALLQEVGNRLKSVVRETDTVARFGGDEFSVVEIDIREPSDAAVLAEKILAALRDPFAVRGNDINVGASIGIAIGGGGDDVEAETLLAHADVALYRAKSEGRGGYRFFTEAMDSDVHARVDLISDLRTALAQGQLFLVYQPQVDLSSGRISTLEALVRWRHPVRGIVVPADFIEAAETSGLIMPLGRWVLREACRQTRQWLDAGLAPPRIAVNISAVQFKSPLSLERDVRGILDETGLPPELLELELTESVLMESSPEHRAALLRLRALGLRIAMDDFGTGYSSLRYLSDFPIDLIKIGQTFMLDLKVKPSNAAIVRAAIGLADELGLQTVVEGVETEEQLNLVKVWGGRIVQGYYFSRPVEPADVPALLRQDGFRLPVSHAGG